MDAFAKCDLSKGLYVTNGDFEVKIQQRDQQQDDNVVTLYSVTAKRYASAEILLEAQLFNREVALDIFIHTMQAVLSVGL